MRGVFFETPISREREISMFLKAKHNEGRFHVGVIVPPFDVTLYLLMLHFLRLPRFHCF